MSKKIKLSINEPCHENWEKMTPVQQGKFCGSCQKQVVDFSNMSDRQVAEFFKKPSTGSVCGRFMSDQLDRTIDIPKKRLPWFKYFFNILLPAFFISKASAQKTMGTVCAPQQVNNTKKSPQLMGKVSAPRITPVITPVCIKDTTAPTVKGEVTYYADLMKTITGVILGEDKQPIQGASVFVKNTNNGVFTGKDGKFSLKLRKDDVISIYAMGYFTNETVVGTTNNYQIELKKDKEPVIAIAGMIAIDRTPERTRKIPQTDTVKLTQTNQNNNQKIIPVIPTTSELERSSLKIFPNPVNGGEKISVECKKIEPGTYSLQWIDQSGQLVKEEEVHSDAKSGYIHSSVPQFSAGTYFMVLTNKESQKRYSQKIVIQ